jgi:hypothetical protein
MTHRDADSGALLHKRFRQPSGTITIARRRRERHPRAAQEQIVHEAGTGTDENVIPHLDTVPHDQLVLLTVTRSPMRAPASMKK